MDFGSPNAFCAPAITVFASCAIAFPVGYARQIATSASLFTTATPPLRPGTKRHYKCADLRWRTGASPAKGLCPLISPAEPLAGCQYLFHPPAQACAAGTPASARSARLGPLCGAQRVTNSDNEAHSGPKSLQPPSSATGDRRPSLENRGDRPWGLRQTSCSVFSVNRRPWALLPAHRACRIPARRGGWVQPSVHSRRRRAMHRFHRRVSARSHLALLVVAFVVMVPVLAAAQSIAVWFVTHPERCCPA